MSEPAFNIPLMRPRLPEVPAILPYLEEIDQNRWYSNFGPLERRFERKLAEHFELGDRQVVCVSNCTQGLGISLRNAARFPVGYCLMPSFTFVATPHAAISAGLEPYFLDVELDTWALSPVSVRDKISAIEGPIAAVMPVAPFGASIDVSAWDVFAKETGIPVVIDAAAGFDSAAGSENPLVLSLHATKVMGIGEGGAVLCKDEAMAENIRAGRNFGFLENRSAKLAGTNAKLSEYGAAIGLAALDCWKETRLSTHAVAQRYFDVFSECVGITFGPCFSAEIANSTCNVLLETPVADRVIYQLKSDGIEARKWWNNGCHKEPVFKGCAREPLPMTEFLTERVVGLPFFHGLSSGEVFNIRDSIESAIKG